MLLMGIMVGMVGGSAGVYYGFVDDTKWLFALGSLGMLASVMAVFRGAVPPNGHAQQPDSSAALSTTAYGTTVLALFGGGSVALYYGFTDDVKLLVMVGILGWVSSVFIVFRGGLGLPTDGRSYESAITFMYLVGVLAVAVGSSVGVYYAFVDDIKILMLFGVAGLAASVVTAARGTLAP
jgi:hypothetical protein